MTSTLTVRSVPDDTLKQLKIRAAKAGMSLQAYTLELLTREAAAATNADIAARMEATATTALAPDDIVSHIDDARARR